MLPRARRPVVEELEPRILYSADFAPGLVPDPQAATPEVRTLDVSGNFAAVDAQSAPVGGTTDVNAAADTVGAVTKAGGSTSDPASSVSPAAVAQDASAPGTAGAAAQASVARAPLAFERNVGQTDAQVDFLARGSGYTVWLADGDAVLGLRNGDTTQVVRLDVLGASAGAKASGENALGATSSYLSADASKWRADVDSYGAVRYDDVYDGVDLRYYGNGRMLEYDFVVDPGARADQIRLTFDGARSVAVDAHGNLVVTLDQRGRSITFQAPISYQDTLDGRRSVDSRYVVHEDGSIGFEVGTYDTTQKLVIDPVLYYGTYLGGTGTDDAYGMTTDVAGNVYVTGATSSTNFPVTSGTFKANQDVFVAKFSSDLSTLLYSTVVGGSGDDTAYGIAVDAAGNAYVTGTTTSADLPTLNAAQATAGGGQDAFVLKLNAAGTLSYATYLGGSGAENGLFVAVDGAGYAYVTGDTSSSDFAVTTNAADTTFGGKTDIFVTKLAQDGSALVYSTFLGGSEDETANAIAVDSSGRAVIAGWTNSSLTAVNAYQDLPGGSRDVLVARLNTSGSAVDWLTYVGGNADDQGLGMTVDAAGKVYVVGTTANGYPVTTGAFLQANPGGTSMFMSILDPSKTGAAQLQYSTYLGNNGSSEELWGVDVDAAGRVYVAGATNGTPATKGGPIQATNGGGQDIYVAVINPAGGGSNDLVYATLLGGNANEKAVASAYSGGRFYVAGYTDAATPAATSGTYDGSYNGGDEGIVGMLVFNTAPTISAIADQTMLHDTSTSVAFTLGDAETAAGALGISVSVSNPTLLPSTSVVLSGTGANRTLTITPAAGQTGSATISLQVTDGELVTTEQFTLTVNPDNLPPNVSAATFTLAENSANGTVVGAVPATDPDPEKSFDKIYFTDTVDDHVVRANLDGSGWTPLVQFTPRDPVGVTVDYLNGRVYWTEDGLNRIMRANLDGSGVQDLQIAGLITPTTIKIDVNGGRIYWVDSGTDKIQRANLDGTGVQDLVTGLTNPLGIDLDVNAGKMYWVEDGIGSGNAIKRANLDGTSIETLINSNLITPVSIALDLPGGKMYWVDKAVAKIGRANLDGSSAQFNYISASGGTNEIAIDTARRQIYWTEGDNERIRRANLDGTGATTVLTTGSLLNPSRPSGIALGPTVKQLSYAITGGNTNGAFAIDPSGKITVANTAALDFETTPNFNLAVTVTDAGGAATTKTIQVNLTNVNEPPAITSTFSAAAIPEDGTTGPIAFTVSDPDTPLDQLQVTFFDSSNPSKIGAGNVQFGGSGANRTVTITPAADAFGGTTIVRIKVSDGQFSVLGSIPVTILPVADTPTVTNAATNRGTQTVGGLVISANPVDGSSVTNYQITNIGGGTVFKSDGITQILNGQFITVAEGGAGLKFTPDPVGTAPGSFDVRAATAPNAAALGGGTVTASIAINNAPTGITVSNAQVTENTDTSAGYVVGTLSTADPDPGGSFTYSIAGGTDATRFSVTGNQLVLTDGVLDYETKPTYQVTVRTTDQGGLTFEQPLTVTVLDVNEAPTITTVSDQTVPESSGATTVAFTVGDPESAASVLTVSATSSNGAVIPAGSLALGGSGANRTLTFTPAPFAYGTASVTLSVSDGTNTTSSSFGVTVTPVANHDVTVDTISDMADGDTSSIDALLMNRGPDGRISLREAIAAANASPNAGSPDRILFNITGVSRYFIDLGSALPAVDDAVIIDGSSQPGYSATTRVEVHGDVPGIDGLVLNAAGSTVRGLSLIGFDGGGIVLNGGNSTIVGNYVGLEADGDTIHSNGTGIIVRSNGNVIGLPGTAERNVISGNSVDGIWFDGGSYNQVLGNYIGTDAAGLVALGNGVNGVCFDGGGGSNNTIGGAGGAQNLIAYNGGSGVGISVGTGNAVLENWIFGNVGLGIDLNDDGVTFNDAGDADTGPNLQMNFPVIYSVVVSGGNVTISGEARPGATVRFFQSPDASGYGQGQTFLGSTAVAGSTAGRIDSTARQFTATFAAGGLAVGDRITATATDGSGNTSEFSLNVVANALPPGITVTPTSGLVTTEDGGTATFTLVLDTKPTANVTIGLSTSKPTEGFPLASSVTFTPSNWNLPQTVTVGGRPDGIPDGNVQYSILTAAATSSDPAYKTLNAADVSLTNLDGVNDPPSSLTLSNQSVAEQTNTSTGYVLGALTSTDPDTFDQHVFSIAGGRDAAKFSVSGNALILTDGVLSYAAKPSYQVIVRATDLAGATLDRTFTISVTPVAPVAPPPVVVPPVTTTPTTTTSTTNPPSTTTAADTGTSVSGSGASTPSGSGAGSGGAGGGSGGGGGTGSGGAGSGAGAIPPSAGAAMDATFTAGGSGASSQQRGPQRVVLADSMLRGPLLTATLNNLSAVAGFGTSAAAREAPDLSAQPQGLVIRGLQTRTESISHALALTTYKATLGDTQWTAELNRMRDDIKGQVPQQSALVVSSVAVTGSLSVGYVLWLLRGGLLLSSLLSSLPAWAVIDPMPVLSRSGHDDEDEGDDPLEKLFGRARAALGLRHRLFRRKPATEEATPT